MAKRTKSLMPSEKQIHISVCEYLRLRYPDLIFTSDMGGLLVGMGVRMEIKNKSSHFKIPDLLIFKPNSTCSAAFFELKKSKDDLYLKKCGSLKNDHVKSQEHCMMLLRDLGFHAQFTIGFEGTIQAIEKYLNT